MFTDEVGRTVQRSGDAKVGSVDDLVVSGGIDPCVVGIRLRVGRRRCRVDWPAVTSFAQDIVIATDPTADSLAGDELLLGRDVLDTQIFDVRGKRLTRVGDIELAHRHGELHVVGVEIGAAPLLRRLGLKTVARRMTPKVIRWEDVHLTSGRGHAVQLETPTARVHTLTPQELAALGARLPNHARSELYARVQAEGPTTAQELEVTLPQAQPRHRFGRVLRLRRHAPS